MHNLLCKIGLTVVLVFATSLQGMAEGKSSSPLWLRASAISPDGKTIVFAYKGNLFTVPVTGGQARQLTSNAAFDSNPVWSPSGKQIAFTSTREGSIDIWIMSATGDGLTRLTTHSGTELPLAFVSEDELIFTSNGTPQPEDMQFPSRVFTHLYKIRTRAGERPQWYSDISAGNLTFGPDGTIIYDAIKGYENQWRKHHTSSIARDIWQAKLHTTKGATPAYRQLTTAAAEDRNPVYVAKTQTLYWLSEQNGTFNVYSANIVGGFPTNTTALSPTRLTDFSGAPVRYLTASTDGLLCFSQDGELYTMQPGSKPQKLYISIIADTNDRDEVRRVISSGASSVSHSPKGKEIAFIAGGDVYVTSLDYKTTRQVTDTPEEERDVTFAEDGRSVAYASERDGRWGIFRSTIKNEDEKQFTYATELTEERLTDADQTCFQPAYSPDGKKIAFLRDRQELCVMDAKSKKITSVMAGRYEYSYSDGDQNYAWSPNSKYLLTEYIGTGGWVNTDIALIPADGKGDIVNLTNSGYTEGNPRWALGGKAIIFKSDRAGYRSHGSWGAEDDYYITFLNQDAFERFNMNKEERERFDEAEKEAKDKAKKAEEEKAKKEKEKKEKADKKKKKSDEQLAKEKEKEEKAKKEKEEKEAKADSVKNANPDYDLRDLELRTVRLTTTSSNMGDAVLDKDGTKLYYVASYALGTALWERDLEKGETKIKSAGIGFTSFDVTADGKTAYYTQGGQLKKLEIEGGMVKNVDFECFHTDRPAAERACYFEHIWHQTYEKLYDPGMNGADWKALYKRYVRFLPHINNGYDFAEMASELLGELNVSHTGCGYRPRPSALQVASLGVFIDDSYDGDGLRIAEIIEGTPIHVKKAAKAGDIITHIDGQKIESGRDYFPLLAGKAGRYTRLTIKPKKGDAHDVTIRLTDDVTDQLYRRWVRRCEHIVDSLSKGRLAYVHIREMNGRSYHDLYRELLSDKNRNRDAVIVDIRHNGGGWLHNDICELLSGVATCKYTPRGQYIGTDPYNRWTKPSCMLICEDNYSNAHGTPWVYKELGIGKLIGAPVPGTMTAVWWEDNGPLYFGIPEVGALDRRGNYLENQQLDPDILIVSQPEDMLHGRDLQLERAVKEMLSAL